MTLPWVSVKVIIVLLNVAKMWATPTDSTFFAFFRLRRDLSGGNSLPLKVSPLQKRGAVGSLALGRLLLTGYGAPWSLAGSRIGLGSLPVDWQASAVPQSTICAGVHQAPDVRVDFSTQSSFHFVVGFYDRAQLSHLLLGQCVRPRVRIYSGL
jgi:hypothetical protein